MPGVYLETTVVSYLTANASRDIVIAAHQALTLEWWTTHRHRFDLFTSERDASAAAKRLEILKHIPILQVDETVSKIARRLTGAGLIPPKAAADALHVAIATAQGMDFLVTWNCRHIANAEIAERLNALLADSGYRMPMLCTPEQLMGT